MNNQPLVSIQIVVRNGQDYIRHCLQAVYAQTYPNTEVVILDNASTDDTKKIIREEFPSAQLIEHAANLGMWPGHEYLLPRTKGEYILSLSVDVMLDPNFLTEAIAEMERDMKIGALQCKMYQYEKSELQASGHKLQGRTIDTIGFSISRSRRVTNIGHGQPDGELWNTARAIFAIEGAAPLFRRAALESIRIEGHIADPDYFWYGDDLDLGWRMRLFGWNHYYAPNVRAWHDRSTTKGLATSWYDHWLRRSVRRAIPLHKRRLDWSNVRFTIIKNDYIINILKDLPWFMGREIVVFFYTLFFEPKVFAEAVRFFRLLPRMLRRRQLIMARATVGPRSMHQWFTGR